MLKIGDKVKIKNIKAKDSDKYVYGINQSMEKYAGCFLTIRQIDNKIDPRYTIYTMVEDDGHWSWTLSMFEIISDSVFIDLKLIV